MLKNRYDNVSQFINRIKIYINKTFIVDKREFNLIKINITMKFE